MEKQSDEKPKDLVRPSEEESSLEKPEAEDIIPAEDLEKLPPQDRKIIQEALEKLPPEGRKIIRQAISFRGMTYAGPMPNPVLAKVTSEHVTELIRHTENEDVRDHKEREGTRRYTFLYFIVTAILLIATLIYLTTVGLTDLFSQILLILGGVGGGFGLGRLRRSRE